MRRWVLAWLAVAACGAWVGAPTAHAQRPREVVLIFPPIPEDRAADSTYVLELAAEVRQSLRRWRRHAVRMIQFCFEADFCEELPTDREAFYSARLLRADLYVVGEFRRASPVPQVALRIMETARQGGIPHFTTSFTVGADTALAAKDFAKLVRDALKDTLQTAMRASRYARECWDNVRELKYEAARERAARAFRDYPNHASAARCLSYVYLALKNSDSLIIALERAVLGDSTMADAWEDLGLEYMRRGDTLQAVDARIREVRADPDNAPRRMKIARLFDTMRQFDAAVTIVREGAERAGGDLEFRHLLARMCFEYRMWPCALDALSQLYELDSALVGDTTFYLRVISVAQYLSDTTAVDRWTGEAVRQVRRVADEAWERAEQARRDAEQIDEVLRSLRMARAEVLANLGQRDSALGIYRDISADDPANIRAFIAAAQLITQDRFLVLDSTVPLDTMVLISADSLLTAAGERSQDPQVRQSVALIYLEVGTRLVQRRVAPTLALDWLEKAMRYDPDSTLQRRARAMSGLALFFLVEDADVEVRAGETCDLVDREAALLARGLTTMDAMESELPELAEQIGNTFEAYGQLITAYRRALDCDRALER